VCGAIDFLIAFHLQISSPGCSSEVTLVSAVRGSQGMYKYQFAKVNKDAEEKILNCCFACVQQFFFCSLQSQIICTSTFEFFLLPLFRVIAIDCKLTLVFCVSKLVRENNLFCPGTSGKMNSAG